MFGAIAELVDNAQEPAFRSDRTRATKVRIVMKEQQRTGKLVLTITDDGCGQDFAGLQKMLSFGRCEKVMAHSN